MGDGRCGKGTGNAILSVNNQSDKQRINERRIEFDNRRLISNRCYLPSIALFVSPLKYDLILIES